MRQKVLEHIRRQVLASYAAIAAEFDVTRQNPWEEFRHFEAFVRHGGRVLDLGCGNGRLYEMAKPKEVDYLGVDHNSRLLEKARARFPDARFELADMMDLRLPEEAFDNVFCIAAFHHVPSKELRQKVVDDIYNALKPDGIFILTAWNLFQPKYLKPLVKAVLSFVLHFGFKYAWNDVWIKWGGYPIPRYYHAFLPAELLSYFSDKRWEFEDFYFTKKGNRVSFWRSFNLVLIVRKK
ncbi:class I SAM-dependent methyltransferase [Candidatus Peregrinibacteria bacterium]|nr:class I SAM-dependent methyltransferase [Candidatus Peregrinibacteria bacterium]